MTKEYTWTDLAKNYHEVMDELDDDDKIDEMFTNLYGKMSASDFYFSIEAAENDHSNGIVVQFSPKEYSDNCEDNGWWDQHLGPDFERLIPEHLRDEISECLFVSSDSNMTEEKLATELEALGFIRNESNSSYEDLGIFGTIKYTKLDLSNEDIDLFK